MIRNASYGKIPKENLSPSQPITAIDSTQLLTKLIYARCPERKINQLVLLKNIFGILLHRRSKLNTVNNFRAKYNNIILGVIILLKEQAKLIGIQTWKVRLIDIFLL
jgi:hypothetical protein